MAHLRMAAPRAPLAVSLLNPLLRTLMGSGVPLGPNVLLTVAGRHSGKPYTFPVALLEVDGRMFVQSPFGDVNWVRNLRTARDAVLTRAGRQTEVGASELAPEDAAPVLRRALAPYTRSRLSAAVLGRFFRLRPDATPEEYVDEARRHPMFELRPATTGEARRGDGLATRRRPGSFPGLRGGDGDPGARGRGAPPSSECRWPRCVSGRTDRFA